MQHATGTLTFPTANTTHLYAAQFLARYGGTTREVYAVRLRLFIQWCEAHGLDPITGVTRPHLELYARHCEEDRGNKPATVHATLCTLKMFYRLLAVDQVIVASPAEYVRMPKVYFDDVNLSGFTRHELSNYLATAKRMSANHSALAVLLGMLGLRVSTACAVQVEDFQDYERDHRVLRVVSKGKKPLTFPLPPTIFRELDRAAGDKQTGQLLYRIDGVTPLDRRSALRMSYSIARQAGIKKKANPHALRHSFITNALDAGIPLRDVQDAAGHSDPRITMRYDRNRHSLDRHAVHTLSAYLAGGA